MSSDLVKDLADRARAMLDGLRGFPDEALVRILAPLFFNPLGPLERASYAALASSAPTVRAAPALGPKPVRRRNPKRDSKPAKKVAPKASKPAKVNINKPQPGLATERVLNVLIRCPTWLRPIDVAHRVGMSQSGARKAFNVLVARGCAFVRKDSARAVRWSASEEGLQGARGA